MRDGALWHIDNIHKADPVPPGKKKIIRTGVEFYSKSRRIENIQLLTFDSKTHYKMVL